MGFKQFAFETEATKEAKPDAEVVQEAAKDSFAAQSFPHDPEELVLDVAETKVGRFRVHNLIEDQLGLVAREKNKNEAIIKKEIDNRWIATKEKAEVEGYTEGLNLGKVEAYKAEEPRISERLKLLDTLLTDMANQREFIFRHNEKFLMDILAQILRVIALKEIELDPDYVQRLILHLLEQLSSTDDIRVLVSEADYENVGQLREKISREKPEFKHLNFEMNPDILKGSCRVETRSIVIDGSIEEQIRNAMTVLQKDETTGSE